MHIGGDLQTGVRIALDRYLAAVAAGRHGVDVPRFESAAPPRGVSLDVALPAEALEALREEASRQGISLSCLAAHSVYFYLAELELG